MDEIITFGNKKYYGRSVCLDGYEYLVAEIRLNEVLFNDNGNYTNEEARKIDESVFFFADEQEIKLSDDSLIRRLKEYI